METHFSQKNKTNECAVEMTITVVSEITLLMSQTSKITKQKNALYVVMYIVAQCFRWLIYTFANQLATRSLSFWTSLQR